MKKLSHLFFALLLVACVGIAPAQVITSRGSESDKVNVKLTRLNLLIKLVPLALKKEQYADLISGIEKARQIQREELERQDKELAGLDTIVSEAVDNAVNKGIYPPKNIQQLISDKIVAMESREVIIGAKMIKLVSTEIQAKLNAGQRKVMAGSYLSSFVDPKIKPEDITDDVKIQFYIKNVFLNPYCYDLLQEMSKNAS